MLFKSSDVVSWRLILGELVYLLLSSHNFDQLFLFAEIGNVYAYFSDKHVDC